MLNGLVMLAIWRLATATATCRYAATLRGALHVFWACSLIAAVTCPGVHGSPWLVGNASGLSVRLAALWLAALAVSVTNGLGCSASWIRELVNGRTYARY
jgi:hypothetical protein